MCWRTGSGAMSGGDRVMGDTRTMTITEFLEQRIAEDARVAQRVIDEPGYTHDDEAGIDFDEHFNPNRMLAECEAKRRILEFHRSWPVLVETEPRFDLADSTDMNAMTYRMSKQIMWTTEQEYRERFGDEPPTAPMLLALAAVYSDHPDFDPEWRP